MTPILDVLIPTLDRPAALAVTLTSLSSQTLRDFSVTVSDQTATRDVADVPEVRAVARLLRARGRPTRIRKHLPRRGMAEQRQFLLDRATAPYVLFLDDDVILEPDVLQRMLATIRDERCGFVGCALIGLSYRGEPRPFEQRIELWDGPVTPEVVTPDDPAWERHHLHSAANLWHVQRALGLTPATQRTYHVAWVGGCVMYDADKLRACGGFDFWRALPREHAGEDVLAQLRVMARYGGCAIIPSGAFHLELPTTIADRHVDAPRVLPIDAPTMPAIPEMAPCV